ncbi:MAG: hypothetical protein JWM34_4125 [Ilumatobacteraceae bacterium]|nr:hypothetical protein [Ilumatobacteraceae bacterium]
MNAVATPEESIRTYLLALENPDAIVDVSAVSTLEAAVRDAVDPIEKLKLLAALSKARVPDTKSSERNFIRFARSWADTNGIPYDTFRELGVSDTVLRAAKLITGGRGSKASAPPRTKSVSAKEIEAQVFTVLGSTFTLADVANRIGGSPMTIRKAVEALVSSGRVLRLGPVSPWSGPGRAPILFSVPDPTG